MSNEKIPDFAGVIAHLKQERDKLEQLIAGLESAAGETASQVAPAGEIHSDTFFGMTIIDAAKKYLAMETRPKSAGDIAGALVRGGMVHESKNFTNTVYTSIRREDQKKGEIISLPQREWGLTERYPEAARKRAVAERTKGSSGTDVVETADEDPHGATDDEIRAALLKSARSGGQAVPVVREPPSEQSPSDIA